MPKTKISEFSATPGNNTDIDGINIAEGCAPSGINDAIRELMAQLKDFQAGTAGDSFNGPVGTTTAAAGAFTTLSASSTVSGAGFSTYLASPPAIGGTAAAAGSFTTLSASGTLSLTGGLSSTSSAISYAVFSSSLANGGRLEIKDGANLVGYIGNGANSIGAASASEFCVNGNSRILFGIAGNSKLTLNSSSFALDSTVSMTVNSGTANGVAYLNGSKVLTTGSALTFDGTNLGAPAEVYRTTASSYLRLSGGDGVGSGANVIAFGQSHATAPGRLSLSSVGTGDIISNTISGTHIYQITGSEQMRLTSTGLGIGTSSPVVKCQVDGTFGISSGGTYTGSLFTNSSSLDLQAGSNSTNGLRLGSSIAAPVIFYTAGTEKMRLDSSGNLGIGTSSPGSKLTVSGDIQILSTNYLSFSNTAQQTYIRAAATNTLAFGTNSTEQMRLDSSGNLGLGASASAWGSTYKAIQILGYGASLVSSGASNTLTSLTHNSYHNGTNWIYHTTGVGAARYEIDGPSGGATFKWYIAPSGTAGNAITFTQAMTLDASGRLLVGSTSAFGAVDAEISVKSASGGSGVAMWDAGTSAKYQFIAGAAGVNALGLYDLSASAYRWLVDSSGNLLVGTTSAPTNSSRFVQTNGGNRVLQLENSAASLSAAVPGLGIYYSGASPNSTTAEFFNCSDNIASRMTVRSNGGIANYSANDVNLSDRREKTNLAPAKSYLDTICAIPVQTFNYIDQSEDDPGLTLGVIAQDVQAVAPELVMESNWGTKEDPKMRLSIYQTDLQYALMKCIQEQQVMINELKAKVAALEAK